MYEHTYQVIFLMVFEEDKAHWNPYINHSAVYILFWSFEISDNILRNHKYMIGLDSYSRQVFIYLDPFLIYISL